jgi:hypothetical protein
MSLKPSTLSKHGFDSLRLTFVYPEAGEKLRNEASFQAGC